MSTTSPSQQLAAALADEPSRPLVTFYDDATGERTELSLTTFDNWVAKTANLMVDGLGLGPGSHVALLLPMHWQTAVWLAASWSVGASVVIGDGAHAGISDLAVCGPRTLEAALACDEVVALSLLPWGKPFAEPLPAGVMDYANEVAGYGDRFTPPPTGSATAVTEVDATTLTPGALAQAADDAAAHWGLESGGRLLTTLEPDGWAGLLALLPAALARQGSVVMARNYADESVEDRLAGEKFTARAAI